MDQGDHACLREQLRSSARVKLCQCMSVPSTSCNLQGQQDALKLPTAMPTRWTCFTFKDMGLGGILAKYISRMDHPEIGKFCETSLLLCCLHQKHIRNRGWLKAIVRKGGQQGPCISSGVGSEHQQLPPSSLQSSTGDNDNNQ